MSDLIKKEDAIRALHKHFSSGFDCDEWWNSTTVLFALNSIPSADRPQGKWILSDVQHEEDTSNGNYAYICSNCHHTDVHAKTMIVPFCWYCGARMKGADDE